MQRNGGSDRDIHGPIVNRRHGRAYLESATAFGRTGDMTKLYAVIPGSTIGFLGGCEKRRRTRNPSQ